MLEPRASIHSLCWYGPWPGARYVGAAAPVPCVHLLVPQGEHLLHAGDPGAAEALVVLAHLDGVQPLGHRPEHCTVTAAGARQADGDAAGRNVRLDYSFPFAATLCVH